MKNHKIIASTVVLASLLALGGCGTISSSTSSEPAAGTSTTAASEESSEAETAASKTETEAVTTTEATTAPETTEAPTEAAPVVIEGSYPCENIGLSVEALVEKMGKEPEYSMFAEPPRLAVKFGDGASYTIKEASEDKTQLINEVLFNEPELYTGEIIPGIKFGVSLEAVREKYPASDPSTQNLNGTYCSSFEISVGDKIMTVYVDFGDDEKCTSASFFQIIAK